MRLLRNSWHIWVVTLFVTLVGIGMQAQVVISNETLASTTLVVNSKGTSNAKCSTVGCTAKAPVFKSIPVTCPAGIGQTCTFHIFFNVKVVIYQSCTGNGCLGPSGSTDYFQFLVDGAAPTPGPTNEQGGFSFAKDVETETTNPSEASYDISLVAAVTNVSSQDHDIAVNLECVDSLDLGDCSVSSQASTMRVDVFEP